MTEDELAERAIEFHHDLALQQHRQRHSKTGISRAECEDCGNDIPEARQLAVPGVRVCVECQRNNELEDKRYGY